MVEERLINQNVSKESAALEGRVHNQDSQGSGEDNTQVFISQNFLRNLLYKLCLKGPGRPKKKRASRHPYEIGRCKMLTKAIRGSIRATSNSGFSGLALDRNYRDQEA